MSYRIQRENVANLNLTATNSVSTTVKIPFSSMAGGVVFTTAVSTATKITWHAAPDTSSTPLPLIDEFGSAVETTVIASRAYAIPSACYGAIVLVPVTDAGTITMNVSVKG